MFSFLFWPLVIIGVGFVGVLLFILIGVLAGALPALGLGTVSLDCPHCGAKTPSNRQECKFCGKSFRDETGAARSVIESPKLDS